MQTIKLPYYKAFKELKINSGNIKSILRSKISQYEPKDSDEEIVQNAVNNPIKSVRLKQLSKNKNKVMIITSDHTRSMPSRLTIPLIIKEIKEGNSRADITILIATGLHRPTTRKEMLDRFGEDIIKNYKMLVHDAFDTNQMKYICKLPSGSPLSVNKAVLEADLLVCEGFIEPHFFAGFSGGRKSILPGICSKETINANHSARAIGNPFSKTGCLENNPIHRDMIYAARKVGVDFILNVAMNDKKKVIAAFAGDLDAAHLEGCKFVERLSRVKRCDADIVITTNGGYPLDQNLYQCPKAISSAAECAGEDGIIIMVASCYDGVGGEEFQKLLSQGKPRELLDIINKIPDEETIPEQWCVQILANIMLKHKLIFVTNYLDHDTLKKLNITPAFTIEEALDIAFKEKGQSAKIVVIPDGVSVIVN